MTYEEFLKKYEPHRFAELTFVDEIVQADLFEYAARTNFGHVLLFGPVGSAKSTIARVIVEERQRHVGITDTRVMPFEAKKMKGDMTEIMREIELMLCLQHNADLEPYVIIEEVDQLTAGEQDRLRAEMNTMSVGRLLMTTNNAHQLAQPFRSRCDCFEILLPTAEVFLPRARQLVAAENVSDNDTNLPNCLNNAARFNNAPELRDFMRELYRRVVWLKRNAAAAVTPVQQRTVTPFTIVSSTTGTTMKANRVKGKSKK